MLIIILTKLEKGGVSRSRKIEGDESTQDGEVELVGQADESGEG